MAENNVRPLLSSIGTQFSGSPPVDPPGGGGDNGEMQARIAALEEAVKNLPTKADFAELRADVKTSVAELKSEMYKAATENQRWTHTALVGLATIAVVGILGVMGTIWNAGKPTLASAPAPAQTPIIINVPAAPVAAPALPAKP